MDHTIDEQPIQVPVVLIAFWLDEEGPHELLFHSNVSIPIWTRVIGEFLRILKFFRIHVTTNWLQIQ